MASEIRILTLGVFDCLHEGHLNLFRKLKSLGIVEVGIVKDEAVKRQKGKNRPLMNENFRWTLISQLKCINRAFLIDDFEFTQQLINGFDIIAVGEDQKHFKGLDLIPKEKLIILPRTEGISTSDIIKRMT